MTLKCVRNAYFLFLNTIVKTRHTIANTIPTAAEMSKITTKATLNVLVTFVGVPSGGTPSENHIIDIDKKTYWI